MYQPKGGWEIHESAEDAGLREVWEEAGLKGSISGVIGDYSEVKKGETTQFKYFVMDVSEITDSWPEQEKRVRLEVFSFYYSF